jgi:Cu(I)/Ag(I) efflux system protein CusF
MKTSMLALTLALAACSPADQPAAPETDRASTTATSEKAGATSASAEGVVESVDAAMHTITIAHGPVPALDWPSMTMTFQAPGVDLSGLERGDRIAFDFLANGMNATITSIERR